MDCSSETAAIERAEADLPRLEVAPPDRTITCITLETLIAFADRLKSHVGRCPNSTYAASSPEWRTRRAAYAARFAQNRCRRSL